MGRLGGHTVDVIDPASKDRHGDPLPGDPAEVQVSGCSMQPAASVESLDGGDTVSSAWDLFLPPGVIITALHRVRWRGDLYEVDGEPRPWDDERGRPHHIEAQVRRVTG